MAIKFQLRGDSLDAYYSAGLGGHAIQGGTDTDVPIVTSVIPGVFGGKMIDMGNKKPLCYLGLDNWAIGTNVFTLHFILVPKFTGNNGVFQQFFTVGNTQTYYGGIFLGYDGAGAGFGFYLAGLNSDGSNSGSGYTGVLAPWVQDNVIHLWVVSDGTHFSFYSNSDGNVASLITTVGAPASLNRPRFLATSMILGASVSSFSGDYYVVGFDIFDTAEDPLSYGVLTDFIPTSTSKYEGLNLTSLSNSDVRSGTSFGPGPGTLTGTLIPSIAATTKHGVSADDGLGSYRGYDLWQAVPVDKVADGYSYLSDGTTLVGISDEPIESDVRQGIVYDNTTKVGTLIVPHPSAVLLGTPTDNTTGTLNIANAVWDANLTSHTNSGSFGSFVQKLLTVAKFLGLK